MALVIVSILGGFGALMFAVQYGSIMQLVVGIYQGASYDDEEHEPYAAAIMVGLSSASIYVGPSLAV